MVYHVILERTSMYLAYGQEHAHFQIIAAVQKKVTVIVWFRCNGALIDVLQYKNTVIMPIKCYLKHSIVKRGF